MQPVYDEISENATLVGFILAITPFGNLLDRLLPEGHDGIIAVLKDDCGNVMSFRLTYKKTLFLGYEDLHEPEFDDYVQIESNIEMYERRFEGLCTHDLYIYPSARMRSMYDTIGPKLYTCLVAFAFLVMIGLFIVFDMAITRRQDKTMDTALQHQAVVQSLFPAEMGKRIMQEAQNAKQQEATKHPKGFKVDEVGHVYSNTKDSTMAASQLAQLYPDATVMFADLVGFTAWASQHEPTQVFHLLETLYAAFDRIAKRRAVFKVETIGDCVRYTSNGSVHLSWSEWVGIGLTFCS
jgi:hypothetical protein